MKGVLKTILALIIIVGGAGIGYLIANNTDLGKASTVTPTAAVSVANAATATPVPTFTPNTQISVTGSLRAGGTTPGAAGQRTRPTGTNGTPGQGNVQPNINGTPGVTGSEPLSTSVTPGATGQQGQRRGTQLVGTISSFDATAKRLVVTAQDGSTRNVSVANAILSKADKISLDDISKTIGAMLVVQGDKADDGSYTARSVMLVDAAPGAAGRGGFGGQGGFPGGPGGAGFVILSSAAVSGTTLNGKGFQGEDVKVNVNDTTLLTKQTTATLEDLTEGKKITVTGQPSANDEIEATAVNLTS